MRLREYRKLKSWTQEQLALLVVENSGLAANGSVVARHETGERFPDKDTIEAYRQITDGAVMYDDHVAVRREWEQAQAEKSPAPEPKEARA